MDNITYITFGHGHVHRVNDITFDVYSVAAIKCDSHIHGRQIAFELFGPHFCTSYYNRIPDDVMQYCPRGIIEAN
jgi:hypothetical protein